MTYSSTRSLVFLTIMLVSLLCGCESSIRLKPVHIQLTNNLPGDVTLTIHCKSKNDDRGFHELAPGGHWEFQFRTNFWGTTLYFCSFAWPGNFHYYDIYTENDPRPNCHKCFWSVLPDGPCLLNTDTKEYAFCGHWNIPDSSLMRKHVV